jgi:hypothetical protein
MTMAPDPNGEQPDTVRAQLYGELLEMMGEMVKRADELEAVLHTESFGPADKEHAQAVFEEFKRLEEKVQRLQALLVADEDPGP